MLLELLPYEIISPTQSLEYIDSLMLRDNIQPIEKQGESTRAGYNMLSCLITLSKLATILLTD